jgi:UDP-glucuronate 4-epimerase
MIIFISIPAIVRETGFAPATPIDEGIPRFVAGYRDYHGV